jgi:hypothetical protein
MDNISNRKLVKAYSKLNEYLREKGVEVPHAIRRHQRVILFCEFENKPIPKKKDFKLFLYNECTNPESKIFVKIKISSVKKQKNVHSARKERYTNYINSNEWKSFRLSIIKERGYKCEKCGANNRIIHAHHLTYERFMKELPEDIQLLCVPCHKEIHEKPKHKKENTIKIRKKQNIPPTERIKNIVNKNYKKIQERLQSGEYTLKQAKSAWKGIVTWANNRNYQVDINPIPTN